MSDLSDYLESELRKHIFRTGSYTKPTNIYIAAILNASPPTDASTGSTIVEPTGGSYARVQRDPGDGNWSAGTGSDGHTDNVAEIAFPQATADWGIIGYVAICDAASGGNVLLWHALTATRDVKNGDTLKFAAGDLDITFA